jgi:hypothetical protein
MGEPTGAISEELIRDAITLAKNMRNNGASLEAIESRLARRGFDGPAIKAVLCHIPSEEPNNIIIGRDQSTGGRLVLVIAGLMISGLGLLLVIGNRTGLAPTVPYFGFAVMVLGGVIMAVGRS